MYYWKQVVMFFKYATHKKLWTGLLVVAVYIMNRHVNKDISHVSIFIIENKNR
jgi:hypothetical protein